MIELLVNEGCGEMEKIKQTIGQALSELGLKESIGVKMIRTYGEARKERFIGSPTVRVDGIDVDHENTLNFSENACRTYFLNGEFHSYPPKDMIKEAIIVIRGLKTHHDVRNRNILNLLFA